MSKFSILAVFHIEGKKIKTEKDAYDTLMEWIESWESDKLKEAITVKTVKKATR